MSHPLEQRAVRATTALLLGLATAASAAEVTITTGTPDDNGGKVQWEVTRDNGTKVQIIIDVPANATAEGKARLLENELKAKGFEVDRTGAAVTIKRARKAEKFIDATHEKDLIAGLGPRRATMDFHLLTDGALAGVDDAGAPSQFVASFGFDGFVAEAGINAGNPALASVDDLLSAMFNDLLADLPAALGANLSLHLNEDVIAFLFPLSAGDGFVATFTSDANAFSSQSLQVNAVAEPSVPAMLALGLAVVATLSRTRRQCRAA